MKGFASPIKAVALFFVFWAVLTVAMSMPYLTLGPEEKAPDVHVGTQSSGESFSSTSGNYLKLLYVTFTSSLLGLFIIYSIIRALKRDSEYFKSIIGIFVLAIVVSGIMIIAFTAAPDYGTSHIGKAETSSGGTSGNSTVETATEGPGAALYAVAGMGLLLISLIVVAVVRTMISPKPEKTESQTEELMKKIDAAMKDLQKGGEVQEIIIRCYRQMCRILSKGSKMHGDESMTPREFERAVVSQTGIDERPVSELTSLFEEARYSTHPIDNSKRKQALSALRQVKSEMESITEAKE